MSAIWYPQLDLYHCIRRLGAILCCAASPLHLERLYILDFYMATPSLLHRTTMRQEVRRQFQQLQIPRPEAGFVTLPAAPLLFHQMEPVQKSAVRAMTGKGLIYTVDNSRTTVSLTVAGANIVTTKINPILPDGEVNIVKFLVEQFSASLASGLQQLRANTGLRRAVSW